MRALIIFNATQMVTLGKSSRDREEWRIGTLLKWNPFLTIFRMLPIFFFPCILIWPLNNIFKHNYHIHFCSQTLKRSTMISDALLFNCSYSSAAPWDCSFEKTFPGVSFVLPLGYWRNILVFYIHPILLHLSSLEMKNLLLGEALKDSSFLKVVQDPFLQ